MFNVYRQPYGYERPGRRGGLAVMEDKTYFIKRLFLYAESFAVQGDMIVSEGET